MNLTVNLIKVYSCWVKNIWQYLTQELMNLIIAIEYYFNKFEFRVFLLPDQLPYQG